MGKFLESVKQTKLNQGKINNLNRPITNNIEAVIKKSPPTKESLAQIRIHSIILLNFQQKKSTIKHFKLFNKRKTEGALLNIYEANITLIWKPVKNTITTKNYRPISLMNINWKILNKIYTNWIRTYINKITLSTMTKKSSYQSCRGGSTYISK